MSGDASFLQNFPVQVLTPTATTNSPPTYQSLFVTQKELNANAASVYSNRGGGKDGHLTLTIPVAKYNAKATTAPFIIPPVPDGQPAVPQNATQYQIADAIRQYEEDQRAFQLYHNVDKALRKQLIKATPPVYIEALNDPEYGFGSVTCLEMLQHLWITYGTISIADKETIMLRMSAPWHPPSAIEELFSQLDQGMLLSAAAGEPQGDAQTARLGYTIILKTGLFPEACREWRLLLPAAQTLATFKVHFKRMDVDRLDGMTTETAGYQGAANSIISQPTINTLMTELALLRTAVANAAMAQQPAPIARAALPPTHYCWTHGASRNAAHTSNTCRNKQPGHNDAATLDNQMGGSDRVWTRPRKAAPQ